MKVLKKGSRGTEVKILQGLLNIHGIETAIDGSFGNGTKSCVIKFQSAHSLVPDGIAGPATQRAMGILPAANSKIVTLKIPFKAIEAQKIVSMNGVRSSVPSIAKSTGYNFVFNAGMFDMNTYDLINYTLDNGQPVRCKNGNPSGGNYTDRGLAFCCDRRTGSIYYSRYANSKGKAVDFVAGNPSLIVEGKKNIDATGLGSSYLNQKTTWNCAGCDSAYFYYMTTLSAVKLNDMAVEGLAQGIKYLINYDGGGSRSLVMAGKSVFSTSRPIPQAFCIQISPF